MLTTDYTVAHMSRKKWSLITSIFNFAATMYIIIIIIAAAATSN